MIAVSTDLARPQNLDRGPGASTIEVVAKISVSLPDGLVRDIKKVARGDVSAFVAAAIRNELDRQRLHALVVEMEDELGPAHEADLAEIRAMVTEIDVANAEAPQVQNGEACMFAESDAAADRAERQRLVDDAVHSGEMEGLHVTEATLADADDYVAGRIDSDVLADRVRERYGLT